MTRHISDSVGPRGCEDRVTELRLGAKGYDTIAIIANKIADIDIV